MSDKFTIVDVSPSQIAYLKEKPKHEDHYQFFDAEVALKTDSTEVLDYFRLMYRPFRLPASKWGDGARAYHILTENVMGNRPLLLWDEKKVCTLPSGPDVYSAADTIFFSSVVSTIQSHFLIHGAAVSDGQNAVLMSGLTGCGKTTLSLELARQGLQFLSDEVASISRSSHLVDPFPRAIGLRKDSVALFQNLDVSRSRIFPAADGQNKHLMHIEDLFGRSISPPCPAKIVLLLETSENEKGGLGRGFHTVDVALRDPDPMLISELKVLDGVQHVSQKSKGDHSIVRFRVDKKHGVQQTFNHVCNGYGESVLYRVKVVEKPPHGQQEPRCVPLPRMEAALELLTNLQNLGLSPERREKLGTGRIAETVFELAGAIENARCYRLLVGNLERTADAVCGLLQSSEDGFNRQVK